MVYGDPQPPTSASRGVVPASANPGSARVVLGITLLALLGTSACSDSAASPRLGNAGTSGNAGTGGNAAGDAGAVPPLPAGEPDFAVPASAIRVTTWFDYGETELAAFFADAPPLRFHRESERIGSCRLMTYQPSSCTPACAGSDACIDQQCRPYPVRVDRGPLDWVWPDGHQTVSASETLGYHAIGEARVPGDVIVRVDGLSLSAPSNPSPAPDGDWTQRVASRAASADVTLRWTNPSSHARIRLHMTDCVGTHGGFAAAEIECESPDSGALVLPGVFLDRIDAGDWSHGECGSHRFERYHVATPDGDDSVRLETIARAPFFYRSE
jgi:hypothetical protein